MRNRASGPEDRPGESRHSGGWISIVVGLLLLALSFLLWQGMVQKEESDLTEKIQAETDYLASHIVADLRSRLPSLKRIANTWEFHRGSTKEEFLADASSYLADTPGFQAIEAVTPDGTVKWVEPLAGNEKILGVNLGFEGARRWAMEKAAVSGEAVMTLPVELVQGGKGFLVFFPVKVAGRLDGFILGVFRVTEWLDFVFSIRSPSTKPGDYLVSVLFDGISVYEQPGWAELAKNDRHSSSTANILGHQLEILVRASDAFILRNFNAFPNAILALASAMSILITAAIFLFQRAAEAAWKARHARDALEEEVGERERIGRELARNLVRIDVATKAGRMGIFTWEVASGKLTWNERMFDLYDLPPDIEPVYETWRNAVHPEDREAAESLLAKAVEGKATFDTEFRIVTANGTVRHVRAAARVVRDREGKADYVTGLNWDVTDARKAEEALIHSEEQVRLLLNSTGEAIYGINLRGECSFANASCVRILGYPDTGTLLGRNMHRLIHHSWPDGSPMPEETCLIFKAFREGKPVHVDTEVLWRADGTSFPAEYWSYPQVSEGRVIGAVVTFVDITERRRAEETIRHMATHDALTDLPTMRLCRDRLMMAMGLARRNHSRVGILFLDLDGFKLVNDRHGHDAGDALLVELARRFRATVRETDTVARVGGDEFLVVACDIPEAAKAQDLARKLLGEITRPHAYKGAALEVSASIGISIFPDDGEEIESLVKLADGAMYEVKSSGKRGVRFSGGQGA